MPKQNTDKANPATDQHVGKLNTRQPDVMIANKLNPPAAGDKKKPVRTGAR